MKSRFHLFQDWKANRGNIKGRLVMIAFRLAHLLRQSPVTFILFLPYFLWYRITVEWFLCIELPWKTRVGPGLSIHHGQALVINDGTVFGAGCTLRSCTTIGNVQLPDGTYSASPVFGDRVDVGANVVVLGPIRIGDDAIIGAGAVVVKDVPANHVARGNPASAYPRK
jgi:putative colanic acid biosynthesis acetyltransferase WcaB